MMYADLIDMQDFIERLQKLGVKMSTDANAETVQTTLENWLQAASPEQLAAFRQMSEDIEAHYEVLPAVDALLHSLP